MEELFPLRVVTGKRFCNRQVERALLAEFMKQHRPVALISPRRYGKTSLVLKVIDDIKYPFCAVDFLTSYDDMSICSNIIKGISELVSKIMPIDMKTLKVLENCFTGIKATIKYKFISLEFVSPLEKTDPTRQVLEALSGLEKLAKKINKSVVVFIDEFQRILEIPNGEAIQASIRNVAQTAQHVSFVFSGSSRHMLSQVFDDSNQPLYMMCEKLYIDRISEKHYIPYIQKAANIQWQQELSSDVVQRILDLTEEHPFYVNYLCSRLWRSNSLPKYIKDVDKMWDECLLYEEKRFVEELNKLTLTQRILLKAIANTPQLKEPTAASFLSIIKMSSGTVVPMLKALTKKDLIFVDKDGYTRALDPLLKYLFLQR